MTPPKDCPRHHTAGFRLNDQASRFQDFRWECLECGTPLAVRAFCPNRTGCRWTEKMMSPQVHTASSAYSALHRIVAVPQELAVDAVGEVAVAEIADGDLDRLLALAENADEPKLCGTAILPARAPSMTL